MLSTTSNEFAETEKWLNLKRTLLSCLELCRCQGRHRRRVLRATDFCHHSLNSAGLASLNGSGTRNPHRHRTPAASGVVLRLLLSSREAFTDRIIWTVPFKMSMCPCLVEQTSQKTSPLRCQDGEQCRVLPDTGCWFLLSWENWDFHLLVANSNPKK